MNTSYSYEPLTKPCEVPQPPADKTSIYQLTRRECRAWWRLVVQTLYPDIWADLSKEYANAIRNEPEGLDGVHVQLSALLAYWVWWY